MVTANQKSNTFSDKAYSPLEVEEKWVKSWLDQDLFKVQIREGKETFSAAFPPPNVTGELHMGHALNATIQDVLIRYNRMLGKDVLWQIGTDHAGIGTQIVVEKDLRKQENKSKYDIGRDEFIKRTKAWKEEYGNRIIEQMKRLGSSPDFDRCRYTMDDHYSESVKEAFVKYFNEGLIYKGKRITNWCPKCLTSLSDLEIDKQQGKKKLYQINYQIKGSQDYFTVATTRPETMFGDTGIAINPKDERFQKYIDEVNSGNSVIAMIPFTNIEIPLVLDEHVKTDFGTGALKVTPAHDANDYEIGKRHNLPQAVIMDEKAKMLESELVPDFVQGLDRYDARKKVLEELEASGQLIKTEEYEQEKDLHDRCSTEIEPYLSDQWYVKMESLAKLALETVCKDHANGETKSHFVPERYETTFKNWLENIQDWCISRQIWWGHRIPVFYYEDPNTGELKYFASKDHDSNNLPGFDPTRAEDGKPFSLDGIKVWQDEDVLDTWFSSALWPFETLKDEDQVFKHFYPTQILSTAREIINLWVSRMIYSSQFFEGCEPFTDILIHPVVQTPDGKRMSKSKGNAINPLDLIALYGADANRMWYASVGVLGNQDVRFPGRLDKSKKQWTSDTIEQYKKFANKLYNASKFVAMNLSAGDTNFVPQKIENLDASKFGLADRWILDKFTRVLSEIRVDYANYDLGAVQSKIYNFLWFEFCDWYIEISKANFSEAADTVIKEQAKQILFYILESSLRALHPIMPFITEEIWQILRSSFDFAQIDNGILGEDLDSKSQASICFAKYPESHETFKIEEVSGSDNPSQQMDFIVSVISSLRNVRQSMGISWSNALKVYIESQDDFELRSIKAGENFIKSFAKVEELNINSGDCPKPSSLNILSNTKLSIALAGLVDIEKLKENINKKIANVEKNAKGLEGRLKSENFIKNAAPEKVQETKSELDELLQQKAAYQAEIANLN